MDGERRQPTSGDDEVGGGRAVERWSAVKFIGEREDKEDKKEKEEQPIIYSGPKYFSP